MEATGINGTVKPALRAKPALCPGGANIKPPFEMGVVDLDHASEMDYNGIAYSVKRLARKGLLGGTISAKPTHQDVDTS